MIENNSNPTEIPLAVHKHNAETLESSQELKALVITINEMVNLDRFIAENYLILIFPDPSEPSLYNHDLLSRNLQLEPGEIPCNGKYERDNDESFMYGVDCYIDTVHVGITVFQNSDTLLKNIWKSNFQWYSSRSLTWLDSKKTKLAADTASLKNLQVNHPANGGFTYDR